MTFSPRNDKKAIETGLGFAPKFDQDGLIVAIAQDETSGEILMVAYMNEASLAETLRIGEAVYYSRSRREIWHKGLTSGHVQKVSAILTDCDQDALVLKVKQIGGGACHNGFRSCFYRTVVQPPTDPATLAQTISDQAYDPDAVYGRK